MTLGKLLDNNTLLFIFISFIEDNSYGVFIYFKIICTWHFICTLTNNVQIWFEEGTLLSRIFFSTDGIELLFFGNVWLIDIIQHIFAE